MMRDQRPGGAGENSVAKTLAYARASKARLPSPRPCERPHIPPTMNRVPLSKLNRGRRPRALARVRALGREGRLSRRGRGPRRSHESGPVGPAFEHARRGTGGGVGRRVPELTRVVPPSPRPSGSRIGGAPTVAVWQESR